MRKSILPFLPRRKVVILACHMYLKKKRPVKNASKFFVFLLPKKSKCVILELIMKTACPRQEKSLFHSLCESRIIALLFSSLFAFFYSFIFNSNAFSETITLTTYYPAPFGTYDQLRLVPRAPFPGTDACQPGTMYIRNDPTPILLMMCTAGGTWASATAPGYWLQSGTNLYPSDNTWNVGIGTTAPVKPLQISSALGMQVGLNSDPFFAIYDANGVRFNRNNESYIDQTTVGGKIQFRTSSAASLDTTPLEILANGNVGIGSTNPARPLDVRGTAIVRGDFSVTDAAATGSLHMTADGTRVYYGNDGGTGITILQANGFLGIGTNIPNPSAQLDVDGQIRVRGGTPGAGKFLMDSDGSGTATWNYVTYAP